MRLLKLVGALAMLQLFLVGDALAVLLVGSESEAANTITFAAEKANAYRFEATTTGTLEAIKFHTAASAQTAEKVVVGIFSDLAELEPKPLAVLAEKEKVEKPGENALYEVTGFSLAVTAGTKYWLVILPVGGSIKARHTTTGTANSTAVSQTPTKVKKLSEVTIWSATEAHAPMFLAGTGAAAGGASGAVVTII